MAIESNPLKAIQKRINYFINLGFTNENIKKIIIKNPKVLTISMNSLNLCISYLNTFKSINILNIITKNPFLLILTPECIQSKLDFFVETFHQGVEYLVFRNPTILNFSIEGSLKPHYDFFTNEIRFHPNDLLKNLLLFFYSLKRIQQCSEVLKNSGFEIQNLSLSQKKKIITYVKLLDLEKSINKLNLTGKDYTIDDVFMNL